MKLIKKIKKFFYLKILKKKYYKTGSCALCGACCKNIYIRHKDSVIKTTEEFEKIKLEDSDSFYKHISIIGQDEFGLVFACDKYDKEKKLCSDHKNRPSICRNYPSEEIFSYGAKLNPNCGYKFESIEKFDEIFARISKKPTKIFKELN